ncbi:hypothetical protein L5515_003266 [Caenorhabditis briggsae]|uniref:Uncharacterized protein n=1 Tax=Caenorhabditis briggsae TaxID=6238 RepID=A0AAE9J9E1_CAEBR|nr:hypothetical protein L5515_003266 [Caenorhabditis briggsae]
MERRNGPRCREVADFVGRNGYFGYPGRPGDVLGRFQRRPRHDDPRMPFELIHSILITSRLRSSDSSAECLDFLKSRDEFWFKERWDSICQWDRFANELKQEKLKKRRDEYGFRQLKSLSLVSREFYEFIENRMRPGVDFKPIEVDLKFKGFKFDDWDSFTRRVTLYKYGGTGDKHPCTKLTRISRFNRLDFEHVRPFETIRHVYIDSIPLSEELFETLHRMDLTRAQTIKFQRIPYIHLFPETINVPEYVQRFCREVNTKALIWFESRECDPWSALFGYPVALNQGAGAGAGGARGGAGHQQLNRFRGFGARNNRQGRHRGANLPANGFGGHFGGNIPAQGFGVRDNQQEQERQQLQQRLAAIVPVIPVANEDVDDDWGDNDPENEDPEAPEALQDLQIVPEALERAENALEDGLGQQLNGFGDVNEPENEDFEAPEDRSDAPDASMQVEHASEGPPAAAYTRVEAPEGTESDPEDSERYQNQLSDAPESFRNQDLQDVPEEALEISSDDSDAPEEDAPYDASAVPIALLQLLNIDFQDHPVAEPFNQLLQLPQLRFDPPEDVQNLLEAPEAPQRPRNAPGAPISLLQLRLLQRYIQDHPVAEPWNNLLQLVVPRAPEGVGNALEHPQNVLDGSDDILAPPNQDEAADDVGNAPERPRMVRDDDPEDVIEPPNRDEAAEDVLEEGDVRHENVLDREEAPEDVDPEEQDNGENPEDEDSEDEEIPDEEDFEGDDENLEDVNPDEEAIDEWADNWRESLPPLVQQMLEAENQNLEAQNIPNPLILAIEDVEDPNNNNLEIGEVPGGADGFPALEMRWLEGAEDQRALQNPNLNQEETLEDVDFEAEDDEDEDEVFQEPEDVDAEDEALEEYADPERPEYIPNCLDLQENDQDPRLFAPLASPNDLGDPEDVGGAPEAPEAPQNVLDVPHPGALLHRIPAHQAAANDHRVAVARYPLEVFGLRGGVNRRGGARDIREGIELINADAINLAQRLVAMGEEEELIRQLEVPVAASGALHHAPEAPDDLNDDFEALERQEELPNLPFDINLVGNAPEAFLEPQEDLPRLPCDIDLAPEDAPEGVPIALFENEDPEAPEALQDLQIVPEALERAENALEDGLGQQLNGFGDVNEPENEDFEAPEDRSDAPDASMQVEHASEGPPAAAYTRVEAPEGTESDPEDSERYQNQLSDAPESFRNQDLQDVPEEALEISSDDSDAPEEDAPYDASAVPIALLQLLNIDFQDHPVAEPFNQLLQLPQLRFDPPEAPEAPETPGNVPVDVVEFLIRHLEAHQQHPLWGLLNLPTNLPELLALEKFLESPPLRLNPPMAPIPLNEDVDVNAPEQPDERDNQLDPVLHREESEARLDYRIARNHSLQVHHRRDRALYQADETLSGYVHATRNAVLAGIHLEDNPDDWRAEAQVERVQKVVLHRRQDVVNRWMTWRRDCEHFRIADQVANRMEKALRTLENENERRRHLFKRDRVNFYREKFHRYMRSRPREHRPNAQEVNQQVQRYRAYRTINILHRIMTSRGFNRRRANLNYIEPGDVIRMKGHLKMLLNIFTRNKTDRIRSAGRWHLKQLFRIFRKQPINAKQLMWHLRMLKPITLHGPLDVRIARNIGELTEAQQARTTVFQPFQWIFERKFHLNDETYYVERREPTRDLIDRRTMILVF